MLDLFAPVLKPSQRISSILHGPSAASRHQSPDATLADNKSTGVSAQGDLIIVVGWER